MAKSRGRKFAELVAPANGVFAAASIPTIAISKLATSTFSVNSESASLGGNVVIDSNDVTEHTNALYFTNARADARITAAALLPLAGGTMTGNLTLGDNVNAYFGASTDLRIYHDGTNSHIINSTGELRITGSNIAVKSDSNKLYLGAGDDLQIYHDGSNSYIKDTGTGDLFVQGSSNIYFRKGDGGEVFAHFADDGACKLRFDNSTKLATTATGIQTTGTISVNGAYTLPTSDGSANQVLQTDGSGTLSFATVSGGGGSSVWSTSGSNAYYTSGSVGIGTSAPNISGSSGTGIFTVKNTGTNRAVREMQMATATSTGIYAQENFYNGSTLATLIQHGGDGATDSGYVKIFTKATGASISEKFRITSAGNVGIGTSAPAAPLHINSSTDQHIILSGATNPYIRWQESSTNKAYMQWNGAGYIEIRNQEDGCSFRIKDALDFSLDGSTYHTVWHAGNDGASSGLDADLLDGNHASAFATKAGANSFSNSYNEFGNSTGSVSNDGTWNARVNIAGSSHARLDVKSVSDGIITSMYAHTGQAAGKVGTYSNHALHLMINGGTKAVLSTAGSLSTTPQGTLWGASNDGAGSGLDADLLDGQEGAVYFKGYSNVSGWQNSNSNFSVRSGGTAVGLHMEESDGTFGFQIYGNGSQYGFLDAEWAGWDIQKTTNGELYIDAGSGLKKVWHEGNDGSGSGLDADLLDGLSIKSQTGNTSGEQVLRSHTNSYFYHGSWTHVDSSGMFSSTTNGAHFYPNTGTSYATWRTAGARGGYDGIMFDSGGDSAIMYDSSGNGGLYREANSRWHIYHNVANNCLGVCSSGTSSSYGLYEQGGGIYSSSNIVAYSDRRIKENIVPIDNALEKVNKLAGVYYNKINDETKTKEMGFIAQDVNEVAPELVTYAEDIDQYGVKYGNTTALLVEAVKELTQQVKDLKQELEELKNG